MNIELDYIQSLIKMASESDLTELKVSSGDNQIVIKKEKETHIAQAIPTISASVIPQTPVSIETKEPEVQKVETEKQEAKQASAKKGNAVVSPIVGTFYSAPSPDSPAFVKVGDKVKVGDTLCIIESMKLMNEIESDFTGTVTEICMENSDAVDSGTVLMYIE
ncbi:MAG: acetyl-CoA carboxylase biotin carboxyl carrier protein [Vampirovibrionia bacterium]